MQNTNNIISIQIPQKELDSALSKIQEAHQILSPYLIALTLAERKAMPKMNEKTVPFVEKALNYMESEPTLTPGYLDTEEMRLDFQAAQQLTQVAREAQQLTSKLEDTITLTGSEAYIAALAYYHAIKGAARVNASGAKPIYEDLKKRFAFNGRRTKKPEGLE